MTEVIISLMVTLNNSPIGELFKVNSILYHYCY